MHKDERKGLSMASLADWYNMAAWIDQAEKERCCPLDPWLNHCPGAWNTMRLVVPSLDEEEIKALQESAKTLKEVVDGLDL